MKKAQVAVLEVSFLQYNRDAPLVNEVVSFTNNHDFVIYDIGTILRTGNNVLLQADFLFVKKIRRWDLILDHSRA